MAEESGSRRAVIVGGGFAGLFDSGGAQLAAFGTCLAVGPGSQVR